MHDHSNRSFYSPLHQRISVYIVGMALVSTATLIAFNPTTSLRTISGSTRDQSIEISIRAPGKPRAVSETIAIISSIVTTATTVALALLTWRYVRLTQQMAQSMESAREPFVDIELDFPDHELRFAFVNTGGTAARNIEFRVDHDSELIEAIASFDKGITLMHPIKNGISYLPAGQRLIYSAGRIPPDISSADNVFLKITISYRNDAGRSFYRTVHYDLRQLDNLLFESFRNTHVAVAKAIREAEQQFAHRSSESSFTTRFTTTSCPICFETINGNAKKCHHCHEWLNTDNIITESSNEAEGSTGS